MTGALSKRAVLRAGYGAVIAVLVFAAVEAYHIQTSVSEQHLKIYRHYVDQDATVATLRRNLWLAGHIYPRLLHSDDARTGGSPGIQLKTIEREDDAALDASRESRSESGGPAQYPQELAEFRAVTEPLPRTMLNESNERQFDFLQREIVPRRGDLYDTLLYLQSADQQRLQESEKRVRGRAAQRGRTGCC